MWKLFTSITTSHHHTLWVQEVKYSPKSWWKLWFEYSPECDHQNTTATAPNATKPCYYWEKRNTPDRNSSLNTRTSTITATYTAVTWATFRYKSSLARSSYLWTLYKTRKRASSSPAFWPRPGSWGYSSGTRSRVRQRKSMLTYTWIQFQYTGILP